jgi:ABC-2 type transport system permease protein
MIGERIRQFLIKEFIQALRDQRMRILIFLPPLIQLFIFGYAVTSDIKEIPTAIYDIDKTHMSRELIDRFIHSGYFKIRYSIETGKEMDRLIDSGKVNLILKIDSDFGESIKGKKETSLQVIVDGTDSNTASVVVGYTNRIVNGYIQELLLKRYEELSHRLSFEKNIPFRPDFGPIEVESRAWFNPNLESRNFYVPGIIASIVMLVTLLLTTLSVVREKEIGTMEQLMVTPIRPYELILGKTLPFALIGFMDVIIITTVGVFWFKVPIRGNVLLLFFATTLYLLSSLGIGLFISTISKTQQQAMMSTFFFFFPAILLSGFVFPIANMPLWIQYITYLNPLRYFLVIIRGIFLKGTPINILWEEMLALLIIGLGVMSVSIFRFKKRIS